MGKTLRSRVDGKGCQRNSVCLGQYRGGRPSYRSSHWAVTGLSVAVLSFGAVVSSSAEELDSGSADSSYRIQWHEGIESIRYSRADQRDEPESELQTELAFKLSPGKFDFSPSGVFGLGGVFSNPELAISSRLSGKYSLQESIPELHSGLSYSAGVKLDQERGDLADTAYISSRQLGVSYGRLGSVWYSGVDLSFGQFNYDSPLSESSEVLTFDVTTGRRLDWTGGQNDPMWLLSLRGNFDMQSSDEDISTGDKSEWYLNPSLFWHNPDFTFSAQLEVPVDSEFLRDLEEPDYRLRAVFEKSFR